MSFFTPSILVALFATTFLSTVAGFRYLLGGRKAFLKPTSIDTRFPAIFCDFDGTITTEESDNELWEKGGLTRSRRAEIMALPITLKEKYTRLIAEVSARHSLEEALMLARRTYRFDPTFKPFFAWCKDSGIPLFVVSNSLNPAIRVALEEHLGVFEAGLIRIVANEAVVDDTGRFSLLFRHPDSPQGHVKSKAMDDLRAEFTKENLFTPLCCFIGNGAGDTSAAKSADLLFVKQQQGRKNNLSLFCDKESIPYVSCESFADVQTSLQATLKRLAVAQHFTAKNL